MVKSPERNKDEQPHADKQYIERIVAVEQLCCRALQTRGERRQHDREDEAEHTERVKHTLCGQGKLLADQIVTEHKVGDEAEREMIIEFARERLEFSAVLPREKRHGRRNLRQQERKDEREQ